MVSWYTDTNSEGWWSLTQLGQCVFQLLLGLSHVHTSIPWNLVPHLLQFLMAYCPDTKERWKYTPSPSPAPEVQCITQTHHSLYSLVILFLFLCTTLCLTWVAACWFLWSLDNAGSMWRSWQKHCVWTDDFPLSLQGVTQAKTRDSAFRRNDAFSKPLGEYWDEPKPYELEDYPKMWSSEVLAFWLLFPLS